MNAGGWVFPGTRSIHTEACGKGLRDFVCKGSLSTYMMEREGRQEESGTLLSHLGREER